MADISEWKKAGVQPEPRGGNGGESGTCPVNFEV